MRRLPVPDVEATRELGRAAVGVMLAVAADSPVGAVLESNFFGEGGWRRRDSGLAPIEVGRPFRPATVPRGAVEREMAEPVAGGRPLIEGDTTGPVDVEAVLGGVRRAMVGSPI